MLFEEWHRREHCLNLHQRYLGPILDMILKFSKAIFAFVPIKVQIRFHQNLYFKSFQTKFCSKFKLHDFILQVQRILVSFIISNNRSFISNHISLSHLIWKCEKRTLYILRRPEYHHHNCLPVWNLDDYSRAEGLLVGSEIIPLSPPKRDRWGYRLGRDYCQYDYEDAKLLIVRIMAVFIVLASRTAGRWWWWPSKLIITLHASLLRAMWILANTALSLSLSLP